MTLRSSVLLAGLVAGTLAFTVGCTSGQRDASNYDGAEESFLSGCVAIADSDNDAIDADDALGGSETRISSPSTYCRCVFDEVRATVPFADFKRINATLRDEGGALPGAFRGAYETCDPSAAPEQE